MDRFRSKAQLIASLNSEHIVRVFDFVEGEAGSYLVQEWVSGTTLSQLLEQYGNLTPEQSVAVCRGALLGLAFAHERSIVHSDVAAENVLIDASGTSKLIDFGLAAPAGAAGGFGTPAFMSPEAARGEPLSPASDVYSTGALLYLLLEGHPPMPGPGVVDVLRQHQEVPAPALSVGPDRMSDLLGRSMAKDSARRPPDAAAFLAELEEAAEERYGIGWLARGCVAALIGAGAGEAMTFGKPPASPAAVAAATVVTTAAVSTGNAAAGPGVGCHARSSAPGQSRRWPPSPSSSR